MTTPDITDFLTRMLAAAIGGSLVIVPYFLWERRKDRKATAKPKAMEVAAVHTGLCLKFWEIEYHIAPHWDDETAIYQVTLFFTAVMEGYLRKDTSEGYRRAEKLRQFLSGVPTFLPGSLKRYRMEVGIEGMTTTMVKL